MRRLFFLICAWALLAGCQEAIDIDVPVDRPRLVLDALVRLIDTTETTAHVRVRASRTSSFFDALEPASLDDIRLVDLESNSVEMLTEINEGSGLYQKEVPMEMLLRGDLELAITHNGQEYRARTRFVPSVPIDRLEQGTGTLFSGDETEVILTVTDAPDRSDFYLFDFDFNQYLVSEDTYYQGQSFQFSYFYDENLTAGREIQIQILGVDEPFYKYMGQLINQSGVDQGPFQPPTATVKGNIVNTTDQGNFALGYFAVCQSYSASLVIRAK